MCTYSTCVCACIHCTCIQYMCVYIVHVYTQYMCMHTLCAIVTTRFLLCNKLFIVQGTRVCSARGASTKNSLRIRSWVVTGLLLQGIGEYDCENLKQAEHKYTGK